MLIVSVTERFNLRNERTRHYC